MHVLLRRVCTVQSLVQAIHHSRQIKASATFLFHDTKVGCGGGQLLGPQGVCSMGSRCVVRSLVRVTQVYVAAVENGE